MRKEYALRVRLNGRTFIKIHIDPHYRVRHEKVMNDAMTLELVKILHGSFLDYENITKEGWQIKVKDKLYWKDKTYRIILCTHPDENYIGVINAYRRRI